MINGGISVTKIMSQCGPADVKAEAGIASFLIRTTDTPGIISVTAASPGLSGETNTIQSQ